MSAYLETFVADLRAGILAAQSDLTADGVYEAEHAAQIDWTRLPAPYAAFVVNLDEGDWGADNLAYDATVEIYVVRAVQGNSVLLRPSLEAIRDYFFYTERLTKGTTRTVRNLGWQGAQAANEALKDDPNRRAGLVVLECVIGEY